MVANKLYNSLFFADMLTAPVAAFLMKVITVQAWSNISYINIDMPIPHKYNESFYIIDCFKSDVAKDPDEGHLNTFIITGALQCWLYCKSNFKCQSLSFDILSSTCSLFNGDINIMSNHEVENGISVTLEKACLELSKKEFPGEKEHGVEFLSISGMGFLIEKAMVQISSCLAKGNSLETEADVSYSLIWRPCEEGSKWVMKETKHQLQGFKLEGVVDLYQISPADELDLCLDVTVAKNGLNTAILTTCRRVLHNKEDRQLIFMINKPSIPAMNQYSIYSTPGDEKSLDILFTGTDWTKSTKSLDGVVFRGPSFHQEEQLSCSLSQFSIPHGVMRNKENVPYVLAGSQVEIQCDQGYGVNKRSNYTSMQTVVCSEDAKPQPCTRIISNKPCRVRNKENGKENLYHLFLTVGIVSTIIAVMLLVMLLKKRRQQKNTETEDLGKARESVVTMVSRLDGVSGCTADFETNTPT